MEVEKSFVWILCHFEWKYELEQVIISNKNGAKKVKLN